MHTPVPLGFGLTRLVGLLLRDVVLTRDEVDGLNGRAADFRRGAYRHN